MDDQTTSQRDNAAQFVAYMCDEGCPYSDVEKKLGKFVAVLFYLRNFEAWLRKREPQAPTQGAPAVAAPQGEAERLREALKAASNSLNTIAEKAGREEYLTDLVQIRGYARSRCTVARAALGGDR